MADHTQDWLAAASCCESERPAITLADLPRAHRDELLRFAVVAAASSAFFIALYILLRPLPSRSLASPAALPHRNAPANVLIAARVQTSADAPAPQTLRRRTAAPRASYQVADLEEPSAAAPPPKRRSGVSRFFRSVFRWTVQPLKTDTVQ